MKYYSVTYIDNGRQVTEPIAVSGDGLRAGTRMSVERSEAKVGPLTVFSLPRGHQGKIVNFREIGESDYHAHDTRREVSGESRIRGGVGPQPSNPVVSGHQKTIESQERTIRDLEAQVGQERVVSVRGDHRPVDRTTMVTEEVVLDAREDYQETNLGEYIGEVAVSIQFLNNSPLRHQTITGLETRVPQVGEYIMVVWPGGVWVGVVEENTGAIYSSRRRYSSHYDGLYSSGTTIDAQLYVI